ncbi:hypothetical protein D3C72_1865370 [compost metagenome]
MAAITSGSVSAASSCSKVVIQRGVAMPGRGRPSGWSSRGTSGTKRATYRALGTVPSAVSARSSASG